MQTEIISVLKVYKSGMGGGAEIRTAGPGGPAGPVSPSLPGRPCGEGGGDRGRRRGGGTGEAGQKDRYQQLSQR